MNSQEEVVHAEQLYVCGEQQREVGGTDTEQEEELQRGDEGLVHGTADHNHQHAVREVLGGGGQALRGG